MTNTCSGPRPLPMTCYSEPEKKPTIPEKPVTPEEPAISDVTPIGKSNYNYIPSLYHGLNSAQHLYGTNQNDYIKVTHTNNIIQSHDGEDIVYFNIAPVSLAEHHTNSCQVELNMSIGNKIYDFTDVFNSGCQTVKAKIQSISYNDKEVDTIILPGEVLPAPKLNYATYSGSNLILTLSYNLNITTKEGSHSAVGHLELSFWNYILSSHQIYKMADQNMHEYSSPTDFIFP